MSDSTDRTPKPSVPFIANMHARMGKKDVARLIQTLATAMAETTTDSIDLEIRINDEHDWKTGGKHTAVRIAALQHTIFAAQADVFDSATWLNNKEI